MLLFANCLILISLLSPGVSQKTARETRETSDIKELTRLESVWNEAHLRGDAATLDKLWAEDLFVTVPDMPVMNKEESLAIWKSGKMKFDIYRTSDLRIRVYGDSAVVTGQLVRIRDSNNKEFEDDWRFTKVYIRRQGKWLVVTWHGSHVGSP